MPPHVRHPLNVTLAGLPELELFESDEQREEALAEIATDAGNLKSGGYWLGVILFAGAMLVTLFISKYMLRYLPWPPWIEQVLMFAPVLFAGWFTLRYLHVHGMTAAVRQKLLDRGIPVCMKCGYSLRGLPIDAARCPECGRAFDERVRDILVGRNESHE